MLIKLPLLIKTTSTSSKRERYKLRPYSTWSSFARYHLRRARQNGISISRNVRVLSVSKNQAPGSALKSWPLGMLTQIHPDPLGAILGLISTYRTVDVAPLL
jgi:hypothetical protein